MPGLESIEFLLMIVCVVCDLINVFAMSMMYVYDGIIVMPGQVKKPSNRASSHPT